MQMIRVVFERNICLDSSLTMLQFFLECDKCMSKIHGGHVYAVQIEI